MLRLRYGIGTDEDHTRQKVAQGLGVTHERVRQIEAKAAAPPLCGNCACWRVSSTVPIRMKREAMHPGNWVPEIEPEAAKWKDLGDERQRWDLARMRHMHFRFGGSTDG